MFLKKNIKPMLLEETEKIFNDKNYIYELKFDGYRALIYATKDKITIKSRNNIDITKNYPELEAIKNIVGNNKVIFDGEIIFIDKSKPSFHKLSNDNHPVIFIAFDILYVNKSIMNLSLIERKKILNTYKDTDYFIKSKIYPDGIKLFKAIKKLDLEGIVAKRKTSRYIPSKRVTSWLKIKNYKTSNFYVHGYIFNKNKYSLLLGEYKNKKLIYIGKVSTNQVEIIKKILKVPKSKNIFTNYKLEANYIKPIYKVPIKYISKTPNNKLREPVLILKKT